MFEFICEGFHDTKQIERFSNAFWIVKRKLF